MNNLPKIIDNNRKSLLETFITVSKEYEELSIATGYWDLLGTQSVFDSIKGYKKIRLLIGREPLIPRHKQLEPEPDYPDKDFFRDLERLQPTPELKALVTSLKELIEKGVLEVRVYRKNFLHAKCYIFGSYEADNAIGIIGSSNFTKQGLNGNTELNALESDHRIVTFTPRNEEQEVGHLAWFDQFWNDPETEEWNGAFTELIGQSPVGDTLYSPYETYIKTLFELYNEELIEEELAETAKGQNSLLDFQIKNVQALKRRLKKYKVAMLADSVGLGKTYTAIEVLKQYLHSEFGQQRVEIICPKSLKAQWEKELVTQGVNNLSPITLQNPHEIDKKRGLDHIASVSLFIIDESHNLKNRGGKRFDQIIEWIRNNPKAHVLLLTATPINNQLSDIVNQILLGTRGMADVLKVTSVDKKLKQTVQLDFHQAIENLKKKVNQDLTRDGSIDYENIKQTMMPILRAFVVRRTRQGIEREYGGLLIGGKESHFPKVIPEVKKYGFDAQLTSAIRSVTHKHLDVAHIYRLSSEQLLSKTQALLHPLDQVHKIEPCLTTEDLSNLSAIHFVYQIILMLGFVPYRWQMYRTKYYGKSREEIRAMKLGEAESKTLFLQMSIYGILRTMFLKRLESSVSSIRTSLETYKRKLDVFERGIAYGKIVSLKDLSAIESALGIGDEDFDPESPDLGEDMELDSINEQSYDIQAIKRDIQNEKYLIEVLDQQLQYLEKDDSKICAFADLLKELKQSQPAGKKVLVFSFYADTIEYLREVLPRHVEFITPANAAFLSSKNRVEADDLAGRFSPLSKKYDIKAGQTELDYLFSTDILSEGQNLQDCGILVNYDLHWNPVRMIQRNGRVNRLGSTFDHVYIYNISPEAKLEEYLQLVGRLEGKINLIRNTIGTDSPVLDEKENPIEFTDALKDIYSDNLQTRIEAMEKAEREADFLLSEDEFVSDLKDFHLNAENSEEYKKQVYSIPLGKWSQLPVISHRGEQRPPVFSFSKLLDEKDEAIGHLFVTFQRDGSKLQVATQLQALEWLRTSPIDNTRIADRISLDKMQISETVAKNIVTYNEEEEVGAPLPKQNELLRIMYENHFSEEEIEQVRLSFQTKNVLDREQIKKLVNQVTKLKKNNDPFLDQLNSLVSISHKTLDITREVKQFKSTNQVLFYVNDNK